MPIDTRDPRLQQAHTADPDRYDRIRYQRAGRSGILLPRISLGLWQNFGVDRPAESHRRIVLHAFDHGITHIDLANNYGPHYGAAEESFGTLLRTDLHRYRDELFVSTKAGYDMWPGPYGDGGSRKYLLRSLEQSLTRMNTDYVDVFYSHRRDDDTPLEETVTALITAVQSGKALYASISNYSGEDTRTVADLLAAAGVPLLLHQPRYSMFDRRPEADLFPAIEEIQVGSAVFSPLSQGLLTDKYLSGAVPAGSRAENSEYLTRSLTDDYLRRLHGIAEIAGTLDIGIAALAIAWVLHHPAVTTAIIGASRPEQIDQAIAASHLELADDVLQALEPLIAPAGQRLI